MTSQATFAYTNSRAVTSLFYCMWWPETTSSATAEIARDAGIGHSGSLKVIRCCANRRGMYNFLLAPLNRNLTFVFNCSWDVTPSLHIHTPPLLQVELEKHGWEYVDMLWCQGAQNIELSNHKLKCTLICTVWSQCTPVLDRPTNIMAIARRFVLTNASRAKQIGEENCDTTHKRETDWSHLFKDVILVTLAGNWTCRKHDEVVS